MKTENKSRLADVQERQQELHELRQELSLRLAVSIGTEADGPGISIDPLTEWARQIRLVNTELAVLADEARKLRAEIWDRMGIND